MEPLPPDALVVRGGLCLPENFIQASGASVGAGGSVGGVSVNSAPGLSIKDLTAPNPQTGYPGILNNQVGVTTVGPIRACGGEVEASPSRTNANHATMSGL